MKTGEERFAAPMRRALALAERGGGATSPNPMVGCVVIDAEGRVLGEGFHRAAGSPHAEVEALDAAREAGHDIRGAIAVVTLEPCARQGRTGPCSEALISAGIASVVYAAPDTHSSPGGAAALEAAGVATVTGVLTREATRLNDAWHHLAEHGRPLFHLKTAQTLNGRVTRGRDGERWVTGPEARAEVHRLRRRLPAILIGVGTVIADDPSLTVRSWPREPGEPPWPVFQPTRIVLDSHLRIPISSKLVQSIDQAPLWVFCTRSAARARVTELEARGAEVVVVEAGDDGVSLEAVREELSNRQLSGVLVEGGPTLTTAVLAAGMVDRWTMFLAPDWISARSALPLLLAERGAGFRLIDIDWSVYGRDLSVSGRVERL